jgi:hypothetical protein
MSNHTLFGPDGILARDTVTVDTDLIVAGSRNLAGSLDANDNYSKAL